VICSINVCIVGEIGVTHFPVRLGRKPINAAANIVVFFYSPQEGMVVSGGGVRYHPTCWDLTDFLLGLVADNSIVILQSL
jgi:hypothetical protein